jgi:6-phosphogluconolactonase (cycloisomerase 2 family)
MVVVYAAHPVTGRIAEIQTLPNVGSGPIAMAVHPAGKFLYVLNYGSSSVAQFAIDAVTGALAPLAASASTGANPSGLALHPGGEFAYVSHLGADGTAPDPAPDAVWTMHIEADGSLDFVDTELAGADPTAIAVTRDGRFAYTTDRDADTLSTFAIDAATGTLARIGAGSVPAGGLGPYALAAAPGSDALYVANSLSATLSQFEVLSTGELVPLDPATVPTGAAPAALALDPSGEFLYAVSLSDNGVRNYRVLPDHTLVAEQPFEVRTRRSPGAIVVAPSPTSAAISSTALYVANTGFGDIAHFTLAPSTGLLTAKIPAQVLGGLGATWIDVHPELPAVYVAHATGATKLGVGPADQLMPPPTLSDPFAGNRSIHAESSGRFAFLVQPGASQAVRFAVDPITGALEDPIPAATGAQPGIAGLHPNGGFLYVPNQASASIAQFDISPASGQLSLKVPPLAATAAEPSAVLVDPTGRFAYVANRAVDQISLYVIDSFLGTLAPLADQPAIPTGASPVHMAMTPNGRFLYVACTGSTTSIPAQFPSVTRYIAFSDPEDMIADGSLFEPPSPSVTVGGTPHALATDAVGKFLYVSLEGGAVEVYPIEVDGSLGSLQQNIASGSGSRGLAPRQHVD